jgi:hypothetical protein
VLLARCGTLEDRQATRPRRVRSAHIGKTYDSAHIALAWDMNLRRLQYFVKIVDIGSLTQAADILHIAQPALSQQ